MPMKPKHACSHPRCAALIEPGQKYCAEHLKQHPEYTRRDAGRIYNSRWRKASKQFLSENPLCVKCLADGRYTKAEAVDHIVPHRGDMTLFWDMSNWQALCKSCHDHKTLNEEMHPTYKY